MFEFEDFREINESSDLTADVPHLNDVVDETRIAGFDEMTDAGTYLVTGFLRDNIPVEHLRGCPEIKYAPDSDFFRDFPGAGGVFYPDTNKIEIACIKPYQTVTDMLDTITHEVGHNEYEQLQELNSQAAYRWDMMYTESMAQSHSGFGFVSEYAKTNPSEDFAESYRYYINDPELLKFMNPGKYEFMKNLVFNGREYGSLQTMDGVRLVMNKEIADTISGAMNGNETEENDYIHVGDGAQTVASTYRCFNMVTSA